MPFGFGREDTPETRQGTLIVVRVALRGATRFVTALAVALVACRAPAAPRIVLVTTTSVGNSGLLEQLLPEYERTHGVTFGVHQVGSGLALKMLADGQGGIAISHAPAAEAEALRQHPDWSYRKIMFNDFLVVGPALDPAKVRKAGDALDAFRRIASSGTEFVSRADQSGTHEREQELWRTSGAHPSHVLPTGQGMAVTLRVAAAQQGYTLTDRATWLHFADSLDLKPLFEGDPRLLNTYAVIVDPRQPGSAAAKAFGDWLADGAGRDRIAAFAGFSVWPRGGARNAPGDRP